MISLVYCCINDLYHHRRDIDSNTITLNRNILIAIAKSQIVEMIPIYFIVDASRIFVSTKWMFLFMRIYLTI